VITSINEIANLKDMSEFSELNITYLKKISDVQKNIDTNPEKYLNIPPNDKERIGGILFEIPELPDRKDYINGLKKLFPKVLGELCPSVRARNTFVIFTDKVEKGIYLTRDEKKIVSGEDNLIDDQWRIIAVSLEAINENQKIYPKTPWFFSAYETILHELYEESSVRSSNVSPQDRRTKSYVQSDLEKRMRNASIDRINNILHINLSCDNEGFVFVL
jgi:hypothetical protein